MNISYQYNIMVSWSSTSLFMLLLEFLNERNRKRRRGQMPPVLGLGCLHARKLSRIGLSVINTLYTSITIWWVKGIHYWCYNWSVFKSKWNRKRRRGQMPPVLGLGCLYACLLSYLDNALRGVNISLRWRHAIDRFGWIQISLKWCQSISISFKSISFRRYHFVC